MQSQTDLHKVLQYQNNHTSLLVRACLPLVGDYKMSARGADFDGWMVCDGRSLSKAMYPELFEVVGTAFGEPDEDSFKLPDYRGRVVGQPGLGIGLTDRAFGASVGTETHLLTSNEMPAHTHTGTTATAGDHIHTATAASAGAHTHTVNDPGHTHTQTTINDDFNASGTDPPGFTADSAGSMTWNNINSATTGITLASSGAHTHAIDVAAGGSHVHAFVTSSVGGGQAHNNMQPTLFGVNVFIRAHSYVNV